VQGLPEAWGPFGQGHFNLKGKLPPVPPNARLVKVCTPCKLSEVLD